MAKTRKREMPAPAFTPRHTLGRLYALPQVMPTAAQLYDAYIEALDSDHLADADLCVLALQLAVSAKFARQPLRRKR